MDRFVENLRIPLWDASLQLIMLGVILWLALRSFSDKAHERLQRHSNAIKDIYERLSDLRFPQEKIAAHKSNAPSRDKANPTPPATYVPPAQNAFVVDQARSPQPSYKVDIRSETRRFYAQSPETDGTFKVGNLQSEAAYDSLYIITVVSGGGTARIKLYENPDRFQTAIQSPYIYLDPVCTFDRQPQPHASRINLLNEGQAVLEGDRWRIQRKLEIDFS